MKEKVLAFKVTDEMGGQYENEEGRIVTVEFDAIITDANVEKMYVASSVGSTKKKVLRYGFMEIKNYLPPATPVDVKIKESQELKKLADENMALKAKLDDKDGDTP